MVSREDITKGIYSCDQGQESKFLSLNYPPGLTTVLNIQLPSIDWRVYRHVAECFIGFNTKILRQNKKKLLWLVKSHCLKLFWFLSTISFVEKREDVIACWFLCFSLWWFTMSLWFFYSRFWINVTINGQ